MDDKEQLIQDIQHLISVDGTSIDINPNYLQYFEYEELEDIKKQLLNTKVNQNELTKEYADEIYEKCGVLS